MTDGSSERLPSWVVALRILLTLTSLLPILTLTIALLNLWGSPIALLVAAPPIALGVRMCTSRNRVFVWAVCCMDVTLLIALWLALQYVDGKIHAAHG